MLYLGTHEPSWLSSVDVPLFVSVVRLRKRKRWPRRIPGGRWALDSGGFTEIHKHGRWTVSAEDYAREINRAHDDIGGLDWAAPQDWMCEPTALAATRLDVAEHQRRTIESVITLRALGANVIPVLQGWTLADYLDCIRQYRDAGIELTTEPIVGVGSICRRQSTAIGRQILASISAAGIRIHAFGAKSGPALDLATSADSMAWSFGARRRRIRMAGCTHATCANCAKYALHWHAGRDRENPQLSLWR